MTEQNYNRQVFLDVGVPGGSFRRFEDLRVSARVRKGLEGEPNNAEIDVYNTNEDSISAAQEDGAIVRLFAGYGVPRLIFEGSINRGGAVMKKQGPDRVLSIDAKDGGRQFRQARINETFDRGTDLAEVFDVLADATELPLGAIEIPQGAQLTQGVTLTGRVSDALDRLARSLDVSISVQDQFLQVIPRGGFGPEQAILVSSADGTKNLIGSPSPGSDGLEVRAILDGRFLPGQRISLDSERFNGVYRVISLEHVLDSGWDQSFYSDLVCREV